jgi:hypothetical protein
MKYSRRNKIVPSLKEYEDLFNSISEQEKTGQITPEQYEDNTNFMLREGYLGKMDDGKLYLTSKGDDWLYHDPDPNDQEVVSE